MRYLLLGLCLLLPFLSLAQEEIEYKEYSYSELIQMIEDEEDTIFKLDNALVIPNEETDQDFRLNLFVQDSTYDGNILTPISSKENTIDKELVFNNVLFANALNENMDNKNPVFYGFHHVTFSRPVLIVNSVEFIAVDSHFQKGLRIFQNSKYPDNYNQASSVGTPGLGIGIVRCTIEEQFKIGAFFDDQDGKISVSYILNRNRINLVEFDTWTNSLVFRNIRSFDFRGNIIQGDFLRMQIESKNDLIDFNNNRLETKLIELDFSVTEESEFNFGNNVVTGKTVLTLTPLLSNVYNMEFEQFQGPIYSEYGYSSFYESQFWGFSDNVISLEEGRLNYKNLLAYEEKMMSYPVSYRSEMSLLGSLYQFYKTKHDTEGANLVYMRLKNLETRRLQYLYQQNPGFTTFFKWKINEFLKLFSAYGTEPARAITMSVYVVLAFAIVYLFFPNYWDSHGKNRIMDRYRFFLKYVNKDSGMHEVYLDEKKSELLASEDFKVYLQEQGKTAPKFFMATALPLYRWSVAGTKSFSWLLSKVDVLKGKWSDTEDAKKGGKSVLLISAFLIALLYDIFIKMLNALMLSINTFTTLGFGEIPIKGLPRYLAIIQGFIGWFMLTIFSVSLISQLLN